jgi:hypothetical protein
MGAQLYAPAAVGGYVVAAAIAFAAWLYWVGSVADKARREGRLPMVSSRIIVAPLDKPDHDRAAPMARPGVGRSGVEFDVKPSAEEVGEDPRDDGMARSRRLKNHRYEEQLSW